MSIIYLKLLIFLFVHVYNIVTFCNIVFCCRLNWDQKFNVNDTVLYYDVNLDPALQNAGIQAFQYARFFSDFSSYNIQKVLMHVTEQHRAGWSYDGGFNSQNIIFHDGAVSIENVPVVAFDKDPCARDYTSLYNIFSTRFGPVYPVHFDHLLEFLKTCPCGVNSRKDAIVAFVTNHPSIETYVDRMKQLMILDNVVHRHPAHLQANIQAMAAYASHASLRASMGPYAYAWKGSAQLVPELNNVLVYQPPGKPLQWKNPLYTDNAKGCLHFANNFLKHARNRVSIILTPLFFH